MSERRDSPKTFSFDDTEPVSTVAVADREPDSKPLEFSFDETLPLSDAERKTFRRPTLPEPEPELTDEEQAVESARQQSRKRTVGQQIAEAAERHKHRFDRYPSLARQSFDETVGSRLPFIGGAFQAGKMLGIHDAANRVIAGTHSENDIDALGQYLAEQDELSKRGTAANVLDVISRLPGYGIEFAATGGAYSAGRKGAEKVVEKALGDVAKRSLGKVVLATVPRAAGVLAQTAANPQMVGSQTAARMLPKFEATNTPEGQPDLDVQPGENFLSALPKGYLDAAIELGSERGGAVLAKGANAALARVPLGARMQALQRAIAQKWMTAKPGRTTADLYKTVAKHAGWDGVLGEVLEERAGDVGRLATGLEDPNENVTGQVATGNLNDALDQLTVEGLAFSVPGLAGHVLGRLGPKNVPQPPIADRLSATPDAPATAQPLATAPQTPSPPQPQTQQRPATPPITPESQPQGWDAKASKLADEERQLYTRFYADPQTAVTYAQRHPEKAKLIAESGGYTVGDFQRADPDLPTLTGRPQDAKLRRQWRDMLRYAIENHEHAQIFAEAASGDKSPGKWQPVQEGTTPPNHPAIQVVKTDRGTFVRVLTKHGQRASVTPPATTSVQPQAKEQVHAQQEPEAAQPDGSGGPRGEQPSTQSGGDGVPVGGQGPGQVSTGAQETVAADQEPQPPVVSNRKRRPGDKRAPVAVETPPGAATESTQVTQKATADAQPQSKKRIGTKANRQGGAAVVNAMADSESNEPTHESGIIIKGDEFGNVADKGAVRSAARRFARENLRGKEFVNRETGKRIKVSTGGINKIISYSGDIRRAQLVAKIPEMIEHAKHTKSEPARKPRSGYGMYHRFTVPVQIAGRQEDIGIVVGEAPNGQWYYSHAVLPKKEGSPYKSGAAHSGGTPATGEPSTESIGTEQAGVKPESAAPGEQQEKPPRRLGSKDPDVEGFAAPDASVNPSPASEAPRASETVPSPSKENPAVERNAAVWRTAAETFSNATKAIVEAVDQLRGVLAPAARSTEASTAALSVREMAAQLARRNAINEAKLDGARKFFNGRTHEQNLVFIDAVETGAKLDNAEEKMAAAALRELLDNARDEIRELGTGKLDHCVENYFPHIWTDAAKAKGVIASIMARRPLEGSKGFLKKRTLPTTAAGIEAGLEPVSLNPVELTLLKLREMSKYLLAQRLLTEDLVPKGLAVYVPAHQKPPEGSIAFDDHMFTVYGPPAVTVTEYVDENLLNGLEAVAESLGVKHERLVNAGRGRLGYSVQGEQQIATQNATPLSVLAHEIGHQIDHLFGMRKVFGLERKGQGGELAKELRNIADLRFDGRDADEVSATAKAYTRKPAEKMAQVVEAYVHAPRRMQEVAPNVYDAFEAFLNAHDQLRPMREIKTSLALKKLEYEKAHGGLLIMGRFYGPEAAVKVVNNYLSPGLRERSGLFRGYLGAANVLNQFQLGWSAFHLGFTSIDAATSKLALAIEHAAAGELPEAVGHLADIPLAPITNAMFGSKVLEEYSHPGAHGGEIAAIVDALVAGGGRAHMDRFYATEISKNVGRMFREGGWANYLGGVLKAPFALTELASKPIMEFIVPRQKLGVFAEMMRATMRRRPNMTHDELREAAAKAWDSTDNRMGQLVYDNLFWHKVTKDLAMASVRSVGWNIGTLRELGGGLFDIARQPINLARNKRFELTHRAAYAVALPILAGAIGAMIQYLFTGEPPESLKDLFYPRTGEKDSEGRDERLAMPTYMRDVYAYAQHPGSTVKNKLHPAIQITADMLSNEDFYGTKIRNEDDPLVQQALDLLKHAGKQFVPFGIQGLSKLSDEGAPLYKKLLPFVGVTPAPSSIVQSKAEHLAQQLAAQHLPKGTRTKEDAERSSEKLRLGKKLRTDESQAAVGEIQKALDAGLIRPQDVKDIQSRALQSSLEATVKRLTADEALHVYSLADDDERQKLYWLVQGKIAEGESHSLAEKRTMIKELGLPPATGHSKEIKDPEHEFIGSQLFKLTEPAPKRRPGETGERFTARLAEHHRKVSEARLALRALSLDPSSEYNVLRRAAASRGLNVTSDAFKQRLRALTARMNQHQ